jgi:hypothetical protein
VALAELVRGIGVDVGVDSGVEVERGQIHCGYSVEDFL